MIINTSIDLWVLLLLFMYEITLNWIGFRRMDIFVLFLWIGSGENATALCSSTPATMEVKNFRIMCKFKVFS